MVETHRTFKDIMENFAAIDFETANQHRTSVCSVGIVVVRGGVIVDKIYELIKPAPNFYCSWATSIHGIRKSDTEDARTFDAVWADIEPALKGLPLVAHNSTFDRGCLQAAMQHYNIPYPNYPFYCTLQASRKKLPTLFNHKLDTVSRHFGFDLANHHHALADAEACSIIALKIL